MSKEQRESSTMSYDEFFKKMGMDMPEKVSINRELFCEEELACFENYFASLCTDLTIYNLLFGCNESISVLNEFNGLIFGRIQLNLVERICLKIACLMDPASSGKGSANKNLSLKRLVDISQNSELKETYGRLQASYEKTGIKIWRNKILAHTDLKTAMGEYDFELKLDKDTLNEIIREIQDIYDLIKDPNVYKDTAVTLPFDKDVNSFLTKLKVANNSNSA